MSGFIEIEHYSSILVLLIGLFSFAGIAGVGRLLLLSIGYKREDYLWILPLSAIFGLVIFATIIEWIAYLGFATRFLLSFLLFLVCLIGFMGWYRDFYRIKSFYKISIVGSKTILLVFAGVSISILLLLVSSAPATKLDEVYYHMLVPARIIDDGAWNYYALPWVAGIWAQMLVQVAAATYHAIGYPDASSVFGFCYALTLFWFMVGYLSRQYGIKVGLFVGLSIFAGMHTVVFHTTAGAHAFGDLSSFLLILFLYERIKIENANSSEKDVFIVSMLAVAATSAKISLLPISVLTIFIYLYFTRPISMRCILLTLVPWGLFYVPVLFMTWIESGSPFGPMLTGIFGSKIYDVSSINETLNGFSSSLPYLNLPLKDFLQKIFLDYSIVCTSFTLLFLYVAFKRRDVAIRIVALLFFIQLVFIYLKLPHDLRFFCGLLYLLPVLTFMLVGREIMKIRVVFSTLSIVSLSLWCVVLYYSGSFMPVVFGLESAKTFLTKKIAMWEDINKLDAILPKESYLFAIDRSPGYYMPRTVVYGCSDIKKNKRAYRFETQKDMTKNEVYFNNNATLNVFRTPRRLPVTGPLFVYEK